MSTGSDIHLSPQQEAAVNSDARAIVVVASAGSGKTEVAARRVERLLTDSPGDSFRILAVSYTLKAADELRLRFAERLGDLHRRVDTSTLHGFAHSLLRQHGTRLGLPVEPEVLVRDADRAELLARWLNAEGIPVPHDLMAAFQRLDYARARCESAPYITEWQAALTAAGALDYASMLEKASELLTLPSAQRQLSRLYAHVIVDEAQNLTAAQYELLRTLVGTPDRDGGHLPIVLVGDDKQSIVSFAGADPQLIERFQTEYNAQRFELPQNFRSASLIVALGARVATELRNPADLAAMTTNYAARGSIELREHRDEEMEAASIARWVDGLIRDGLPTAALAPREAPHIRPEEIAVLGRSAASLRAVRSALEAVGHKPATSSTPEEWLGTLSGKLALEVVALRSAVSHQSTHWELSRLLGVDETDVRTPEALMEVMASSTETGVRELAKLCTLDSPDKFIAALSDLVPGGDAEDAWLAGWHADLRQLTDSWRSFVAQTDAAARSWGNFRIHVSRVQRGDDLDAGVRVITIHKAQGREYRAVALVGLNDGQLPDFRATTADEQLSELRTFYVAVTRPTRLLLLSRAMSRQTRYGARAADPSPYLSLVEAAA